MSLITAYAALGAGVLLWAFLVSRLRAKSWQTKGEQGAIHEGGDTLLAPARIGLWIFLGVVSSLFALFITAYHMRMMDGMKYGDWIHFPAPRILWLNTLALLLGSIAMQWARSAADRGHSELIRGRLLLAGLLTCGFLAGQLLAWGEVRNSAFFSPANPAVAFFYVLTAVHGLHMAGGLVVWARTVRRLTSPAATAPDVRLTVGLCTVYWHYLLLVWLVLFGLMLST